METKIRVAIPTNDGQVIARNLRSSRGFLIVTIEHHEIVQNELKWNLLSEMIISGQGYLYNLCDCDVVLVNEIDPCLCRRMEAERKEIILIVETDISQALINYLAGFIFLTNIKQSA